MTNRKPTFRLEEHLDETMIFCANPTESAQVESFLRLSEKSYAKGWDAFALDGYPVSFKINHGQWTDPEDATHTEYLKAVDFNWTVVRRCKNMKVDELVSKPLREALNDMVIGSVAVHSRDGDVSYVVLTCVPKNKSVQDEEEED